MQKEEKFRINDKISVLEVRVVNDEGVMMGLMSTSDAIETAAQKGLDLVEIAPNAKPPTCKIMDYGKWKFKMSKKEKHSRKNQVKVIIKEVQLRPRTDAHDLEIKMKKAKEFLINGCKVKIHLRYSGREMAHKELGVEMLNKVIAELKPLSSLETEVPQMEKRSAFLLFTPNPTLIKESQKKKKQHTEDKATPAASPEANKTDTTPSKASESIEQKSS